MTLVNQIQTCLAGLTAGHIHLCWITSNTVWSHMAGDAL